ncbi:MAG TPA: GldG family protein [Candidatus Limnocylindrales bacterium]|nr:GldG family protein [Candidatus Limnocylindrales bacterium]
MAANWLKTRQTKYATYATVYTLVILAVLAAVNFLANRYDKFYDSTKNKQFSLSEQTDKVVKGLKNDVTLTYFGETSSFVSAKDLLDRYSDLSPKLHVKYIDPVKKPQIAKSAGYRSDSPVVVTNGVRSEGAKSLTEEEVTGAMIRALKTGERNVCFVTGAGEHTIDDSDGNGFSNLKTLLERDNYKTRGIALKPAAAPDATKNVAIGQTAPAGAVEVPKDCTALVIAGPQTAYPAPSAAAIKNYVEGGGHAFVMLDNVIRIGRSEPASDQPDLAKVLEDWGVTVNKDLVLDLSGLGQIFGFGPEVAVIGQYESHPITQPMTRVPTAFPLIRSLDTKNGAKTTVTKLFSSGEDSIAVTDVPASGAIDPKKGKKGPLTLMAVGTYTGTPNGRFAVIGSSLWATNSLTGSRQLGNRDLFVNTINWLTSDEDLISIMPKSPEDQQFNVTPQRLGSIFWLSILIFPLGVVGFGLATWWKRR